MSATITAVRIRQCAEKLFAEQGFDQTTLRQITLTAQVNLAAVNYHFGSKQGLIKAVAQAHLDPLCNDLEQAIAQRRGVLERTIVLQELMEMLVRAMLQVQRQQPQALPLFTRLLELAYVKEQAQLRQFLMVTYKPRLDDFLQLIRQDSAPMEDDEFFWRLHFLLGAIMFTLSNYPTLSAMEQASVAQQTGIERMLHLMIPVLSAGFHARADRTVHCRV